MFKDKLKAAASDKGLLFCITTALCCMFFFFGSILIHPNQTFFGATDDGIQAYYGAVYHVKYDTSYWHMNAMNYPYGEEVFFTGCQPFVTNPIKLICSVIDISDYTIGILNYIMLWSVFFCAICLYLIFRHLKLPSVYATLAALGITFLSPQLVRLACHYSLTYQFAIPLFLLLLLKFNESPTYKKTLWISLLVFFMAGTHFYFFGFFALIAAFYWLYLFVSKGISKANAKFCITHAFLQMGLPFILFQLIAVLIDNVHDRTANPWGYLTYISNFAGVFYPVGKPYEKLLNIAVEEPYTVEGTSFVGIIGVVVFAILILGILFNLIMFRFKKMAAVTDNTMLTIFFWSSILALIVSFGYPFKIRGFEHYLQYFGLLKQMRGIGRFAWAFYYIVNIIAFYKLYQWFQTKAAYIKGSVFALIFIVIGYDAYCMINPIEHAIKNRVARMEDKENKLPENQWLNEIDINKYQSIISLPYFHVGSENVWMIHPSEIMGYLYITSMKTGLPTFSSVMSRTSISQTYKNISIILEPYRSLEIIKDVKSTKPFLVLVIENELNADEKRFLQRCKKIKNTPLFNVYELLFEDLQNNLTELYARAKEKMEQSTTTVIDGFNYTDSLKTFVYDSYNSNANLNKSNDFYLGYIKDYDLVFFDTLPNFTGEQEYTVSFWMENFTEDLYPRASCVLEGIDSTGVSYNRKEYGMHTQIRIVDGTKALIENTINIKSKQDKLAITMWHYEIFSKKKMLEINDLLIRPSKDTLFKVEKSSGITINTRSYIGK